MTNLESRPTVIAAHRTPTTRQNATATPTSPANHQTP